MLKILLQEDKQLSNQMTGTLDDFARLVAEVNHKWWIDLKNKCPQCINGIGFTGIAVPNNREICKKCKGQGYLPLDRNIGEMLMLVTSELAEAMEGHRKNLQDDKLPQYKMFDVEIADAVIRLFDIAGHLIPNFAEIFHAKMLYNSHRADHKIESRLSENGKKY